MKLFFAILLQAATIVVGSPVTVRETDGAWVPGVVTGVEKKADGSVDYKVSWKSENFTAERYVAADRIRATGSAVDSPRYKLGENVEARNYGGSGDWERGTIVRIEGSPGAWRYRLQASDPRFTIDAYEKNMRAASGPAKGPLKASVAPFSSSIKNCGSVYTACMVTATRCTINGCVTDFARQATCTAERNQCEWRNRR